MAGCVTAAVPAPEHPDGSTAFLIHDFHNSAVSFDAIVSVDRRLTSTFAEEGSGKLFLPTVTVVGGCAMFDAVAMS